MSSIISDRPNRPLVVKCGHEGIIRSVTFPSADTCRLGLLRTRLEECFHLSASPFYLVYTDDDGEDFSIRSELDLTEAISYFVSGDDTVSVLSNSSSEKVTLRLDVVVEYDGPSLSDTSSLSSFRTTEQTTESEEDPVYDDLASFSDLGNRWLREQSRLTRRNVRIPTEEDSSDEGLGDFALVRNDHGGYYYETSLYEVARAPDSTGPPLLAPDCSACGTRLEYMRYVCLACGENDMHQVDEEDDSETVYQGAKVGFELCHGCIETQGTVHSRNTRHAFREKIWGPNGWADVEYNEDSACSICASAIHSHRYKCISCSRFDLCRSCYAKVNEIHPAHPFLLLPDRPSRLHAGVFCHNCLQDIVGPRFHCAVCPSWDLCSKCENVPIDEASGHTSDHIMMKIPVPLASAEVEAVSRRARDRWQRESTLVQNGQCSHCGDRISGTRYQCANCSEQYSLCDKCEKRSHRVHDPRHAFFKLDRPPDVPLRTVLPLLYRGRVGEIPPGVPNESDDAYLEHVLHWETVCDVHADQIRGAWLRCANCDYDVCEIAADHDPLHVFLVLKARVNMEVFRELADLSAPQSKPLLAHNVYL